MRNLLIALTLSLPTMTMAADDYQCLQQNYAGRSGTSGWFQTNDLDFADNMARNYVIAETRMTRQTSYLDSLKSTRLVCFDRTGDPVFYRLYQARPLCDVSRWDGRWECDEYEVDVQEIVLDTE